MTDYYKFQYRHTHTHTGVTKRNISLQENVLNILHSSDTSCGQKIQICPKKKEKQTTY